MNASPPSEANPDPIWSGASSLHGGPGEAFDRLTRLASLALRVPLAVVALIDNGRLLVASQVGMPEPWASDTGVPLPHAIFRHALATSKPFVVEDTTRHPLMRDMALADEWRQSAYCGVPIVVDGRRVVGVIFVMDPRPRQWAQREIAFLQDLAGSAAAEAGPREEPEAVAETPVSTRPHLLVPSNEGLLTLDAEWHIRSVNPRGETILGRTSGELLGLSLLNVFPHLVGSLFHHEYVRAFTEQTPIEVEAWCGTLNLWLESRAYPFDAGLAVHLRDVSARRNAEEALRQSESRYRSVFQESRDPIIFTSVDGTVIECNRAVLDLFGFTRDELFRMRVGELFVDAAARAHIEQHAETAGAVTDQEAQLRTKDGSVRDCIVSLVARRSAEGDVVGWLVTVRDNSERKRMEEELTQNAFHDPLTGLANRAVFIDRLERLFMMAQRRPGYRFAVLFIDLDRFKIVNDTFGHMAGDQLLSAVARRLESCLRQEDSVARLGGDEFGILLDNVQDVRDTTRVAERVNQELGLPIRLGQREIACSASIGIALSDATHERPDQILAEADSAMYRAKGSGGTRYEVFDTEMHLRAVAEVQMEADLRRAVRDAEFVVHYQPVIALESGEIAGFEALLRWKHPERGLLHPGEFVDVAEQTGLSSDMGWTVLERASSLMHEWQERAPGADFHLGMSVNLSVRNLEDPDLLRRIDEILAGIGIDASTLRLEINEIALMESVDESFDVLARLRERGLGLAIDNFGTGFTSIRYLQQLPISAIKIDRSFLKAIDHESTNRRVVESTLALGRTLAIPIIATGVESLEQLTELRRLGVRYAQGYLLCEPLDADSATELVLERVPS